ncbi:mRNA cap guanine-N7 methyltransferase [Vanrija albida]|uniref:mRNA cap guanine-N(7) methyltransferase n=1 Tax=Vanrija albida TaxID=181172 RepID=A0ABR3Q6F5_9TREE
MVYDPVRDCDIPSPAVSSRPPIWGSDPPNAPPPPAFHDRSSISSTPSNRPNSRGGPGSLRGLLNDDAPSPTSRRGSEVTVSSIPDDDRDYHHSGPSSHSRPHLAKLLNEPPPPLVRSTSSGAPENRPDNRLREQRESRESYGQPQGSKRPSEGADDLRPASRPRTESYHGNAASVASHYNSRQEVGLERRDHSPIIGLKKFNNWVKSVLIGKFVGGEGQSRRRAGSKILDIGCGKGGDLNKWKLARISLYVGMDIADVSVDQARERYNQLRGHRFEAYFKAHDCYARPISEALPEEYKRRDLYDNVTMQFCMHYAFETASKARMMIENVSRYLRKGGVFIGTIPNTALLLERLEEIPEGQPLEFGNSCYSITFDERRHKGLYGHAYHFYLEDAVDVPEYTVDWDNFVSLAREYGLELIYKKTFNDILQEEQSSNEYGPLLGRMGVINEEGESSMDSDQWEAANLYMGFAFVKV